MSERESLKDRTDPEKRRHRGELAATKNAHRPSEEDDELGAPGTGKKNAKGKSPESQSKGKSEAKGQDERRTGGAPKESGEKRAIDASASAENDGLQAESLKLMRQASVIKSLAAREHPGRAVADASDKSKKDAAIVEKPGLTGNVESKDGTVRLTVKGSKVLDAKDNEVGKVVSQTEKAAYSKAPLKSYKLELNKPMAALSDGYRFSGVEDGERRDFAVDGEFNLGKLVLPGKSGQAEEYSIANGAVLDKDSKQAYTFNPPTQMADGKITGGSLTKVTENGAVEIPLASIGGAFFELYKSDPNGNRLTGYPLCGIARGLRAGPGGLEAGEQYLNLAHMEQKELGRLISSTEQAAEIRTRMNSYSLSNLFADNAGDLAKQLAIRNESKANHDLLEKTIMTGKVTEEVIKRVKRIEEQQTPKEVSEEQKLAAERKRLDAGERVLEKLPEDVTTIQGGVRLLVPAEKNKNGQTWAVKKLDIVNGEFVDAETGEKRGGFLSSDGRIALVNSQTGEVKTCEMKEMVGAIWHLRFRAGNKQGDQSGQAGSAGHESKAAETEEVDCVSLGRRGLVSKKGLLEAANAEHNYTFEMYRKSNGEDKAHDTAASQERLKEFRQHIDNIIDRGFSNNEELNAGLAYLMEGPLRHVKAGVQKESEGVQAEEVLSLPEMKKPELADGQMILNRRTLVLEKGKLYETTLDISQPAAVSAMTGNVQAANGKKEHGKYVGELLHDYKVKLADGEVQDLREQARVVMQFTLGDNRQYRVVGAAQATNGEQPLPLMNVAEICRQANKHEAQGAKIENDYLGNRSYLTGPATEHLINPHASSSDNLLAPIMKGLKDEGVGFLATAHIRAVKNIVDFLGNKMPQNETSKESDSVSYLTSPETKQLENERNRVLSDIEGLFAKCFKTETTIGQLDAALLQTQWHMRNMAAQVAQVEELARTGKEIQEQVNNGVAMAAITVATAGTGAAVAGLSGGARIAALGRMGQIGLQALRFGGNALGGGVASVLARASDAGSDSRNFVSGMIEGVTIEGGRLGGELVGSVRNAQKILKIAAPNTGTATAGEIANYYAARGAVERTLTGRILSSGVDKSKAKLLAFATQAAQEVINAAASGASFTYAGAERRGQSADDVLTKDVMAASTGTQLAGNIVSSYVAPMFQTPLVRAFVSGAANNFSSSSLDGLSGALARDDERIALGEQAERNWGAIALDAASSGAVGTWFTPLTVAVHHVAEKAGENKHVIADDTRLNAARAEHAGRTAAADIPAPTGDAQAGTNKDNQSVSQGTTGSEHSSNATPRSSSINLSVAAVDASSSEGCRENADNELAPTKMKALDKKSSDNLKNNSTQSDGPNSPNNSPAQTVDREPTARRSVQLVKESENLGVPYDGFKVKDNLGRDVDFFLSSGSNNGENVPLIVYIQGSDSSSNFYRDAVGKIQGRDQSLILEALGDRPGRVMVVEKPGTEFLWRSEQPGTARGASAKYQNEQTSQRWLEAVRAAVEGASGLDGIDPKRILIVGHSEGSQVAAALAEKLAVSHVACLAGSDFVPGVNAPTREAIEANRGSKEIYLGHTWQYWDSWLEQQPMAQSLLSSPHTKVLLAHGINDSNSNFKAFEQTVAQLQAAGKQDVVVKIDDYDHGFNRPGQKEQEGTKEIFGDVLNWFYQPSSKTADTIEGSSTPGKSPAISQTHSTGTAAGSRSDITLSKPTVERAEASGAVPAPRNESADTVSGASEKSDKSSPDAIASLSRRDFKKRLKEASENGNLEDLTALAINASDRRSASDALEAVIMAREELAGLNSEDDEANLLRIGRSDSPAAVAALGFMDDEALARDVIQERLNDGGIANLCLKGRISVEDLENIMPLADDRSASQLFAASDSNAKLKLAICQFLLEQQNGNWSNQRFSKELRQEAVNYVVEKKALGYESQLRKIAKGKDTEIASLATSILEQLKPANQPDDAQAARVEQQRDVSPPRVSERNTQIAQLDEHTRVEVRTASDTKIYAVNGQEHLLVGGPWWWYPAGEMSLESPGPVKVHVMVEGPNDLAKVQSVLIPYLINEKDIDWKTANPSYGLGAGIDPSLNSVLTKEQLRKGITIACKDAEAALRLQGKLDEILASKNLMLASKPTGHLDEIVGTSNRVGLVRDTFVPYVSKDGHPGFLLDPPLERRLSNEFRTKFGLAPDSQFSAGHLRLIEKETGLRANTLALGNAIHNKEGPQALMLLSGEWPTASPAQRGRILSLAGYARENGAGAEFGDMTDRPALYALAARYRLHAFDLARGDNEALSSSPWL